MATTRYISPAARLVLQPVVSRGGAGGQHQRINKHPRYRDAPPYFHVTSLLSNNGAFARAPQDRLRN